MRDFRRTKPVFDSLVDELAGDLQEATERQSAAARAMARTPLYAFTSVEFGQASKGQPARSSLFDQHDEPDIGNQFSISINEVRDALGLVPGLTLADVAALRRNFALLNHPDRFPADLRDLATERMMIANALCDDYSKVPGRTR